jgi:hypothetical protein
LREARATRRSAFMRYLCSVFLWKLLDLT